MEINTQQFVINGDGLISHAVEVVPGTINITCIPLAVEGDFIIFSLFFGPMILLLGCVYHARMHIAIAYCRVGSGWPHLLHGKKLHTHKIIIRGARKKITGHG